MPTVWRRFAALFAAVTLWAGLAGCASDSGTFSAEVAAANSASGQTTTAKMTAGQAGAFVGSIGVNVHFNYYGSIYTSNTPLMIARLQTLGITHLRDALCWQGPQTWNTYYTVHQQLGALGFKTDYIAYINQPMSEVAAYPGLVPDMEAIEPANEYDISGDGNWAADIKAEQAQIRATILAAPAAKGVTVLAPSLAYPTDAAQLGNVAAMADAGNLHGYFGAYNPGSPYVNPTLLMGDIAQNTPGKPTWVTETGYFAAPGPIFGTYGVTPAVQAIYGPRALLEFWNAGAARTYLYELADDLEPGQNPVDFHWGLLDSTGAAKPSFTALANLIGLLNDPGPAFTPAPLALSIKTSASSVHYALLGKRDGSYYLAVWNEVQSYDFINNVELTPAAQSITLTLGETPVYNGTQQFDTTGNYTTKASLPTKTLTLAVTDKLQVVTLIF